MRTWADVKEDTLKRIFSYSRKGTVIPSTDGNQKDYLLSMPSAAEAAQLVIVRYKPIIKSISISQVSAEVCDGSFREIVHHYNEDLIYEFADGKCYSFEVDDPATVYIESIDGSTVYATHTNVTAKKYTEYKGTATGFRIRFSGLYPYTIRNCAAYPNLYSTIPSYKGYNQYDIKELVKEGSVERFIKLSSKPLSYEGSFDLGQSYMQGHPNFITPDLHTVVLPYEDEGQFDVFYHWKPTPITSETLDTFVPEIWEDTIPLLPLYMASYLYKNEDPSIAQLAYNEFVDNLQETQVGMPSGNARYINTKGWV